MQTGRPVGQVVMDVIQSPISFKPLLSTTLLATGGHLHPGGLYTDLYQTQVDQPAADAG